MTRARWAALLVLIAAAAAAAIALAGRSGQRGEDAKPQLMLLTSLPLMFGEEFRLDQQGSPLLDALGERYRIVPVDVTDPATLARGRLLLMAQPRAQAAENLVALDEWVRGGGRLLLFADPMLEWPSDKPLGDLTRAPAMFADTGLLAHWGLRLDAPDRRGPAERTIGPHEVLTVSPGAVAGKCAVEEGGLVARCAIGRGQAVVVADADLLDLDGLGEGGRGNRKAVLDLLESLAK